jgi:hypothetical protein
VFNQFEKIKIGGGVARNVGSSPLSEFETCGSGFSWAESSMESFWSGSGESSPEMRGVARDGGEFPVGEFKNARARFEGV